jgi:ribosomal protein L20A (L18A)
VINVIESIIVFIIDLFANALFYFYTPKSKLEKNIEKLNNEKWFSTLYDDFRYSYIIWNNKKVKRFLVKSENVELLIRNELERDKFIRLIKHEHAKFVNLNKY